MSATPPKSKPATANSSTPAGGTQSWTFVDVEQVSITNPESAVKTFTLSGKPKQLKCDVLIVGGSMGGVAAAIRASNLGAKVILTEETAWLGGQMTSQGVSALDENYLVESSGATRLYQILRESIRDHYRNDPAISPQAAKEKNLNPGTCWVSRLSFEPIVALTSLSRLIEKHGQQANISILTRLRVVAVKRKAKRIHSVKAVNLDTGKFVEIHPRFVLDATELGDVLPLAEIPYVSGAESNADTGELHAPEFENPDNVQDFTYPFVLEYEPSGNHRIDKPPFYDEFVKNGKFSFLGYKMFSNAPAPNGEYLPFWTYRRLIDKDLFPNSPTVKDVAMINWESNDLRGHNIIDASPEVQAQRLALGKSVSLGFLYWLQNEAPRDDKGKGYPELHLRFDVLGTTDGLSKYPYIRESRRIKALRTVKEEQIAAANNSSARAELFDDSVGIGLYPIDIHGHQDVPNAGQAARPFQIPLSCLVQETITNFAPACKNIGTTHVTNGAFRLHPVEWAIGEAAGLLAVYCIKNRTTPTSVFRNRLKRRQLQDQLLSWGAPLYWYDDVPTWDENFQAIQFLTVSGIMKGSQDDLHFRPDDLITKEEAAEIATTVKLIDSASMIGKSRRQVAQEIFNRKSELL